MGLGRSFGRTLRRLTSLFYCFPKAMWRSGRMELNLLWKTSGCKYTCHAHCRDLVTLDCQQNGSPNDSPLSPLNPLSQDHLNNNNKSSNSARAEPEERVCIFFTPLLDCVGSGASHRHFNAPAVPLITEFRWTDR
ncbi:ras association domain-containing protein 5-like [Astyanax mexicanus]|uniref:Ras association domain-containing protein 5-like n=1 Tax=Astyanax mexicanus TaxID=7994 RepID=A0A8T2MHT2_ASTMX|nr:ras association domain-containing protein 5-like [Astyanax mexicanus]